MSHDTASTLVDVASYSEVGEHGEGCWLYWGSANNSLASTLVDGNQGSPVRFVQWQVLACQLGGQPGMYDQCLKCYRCFQHQCDYC
jgi:hypothetical protein